MRIALAGAAVAAIAVVGSSALAAVPASAAELPTIVINEIESSGGTPGDWVELKNTGSVEVDATGLIFSDNDDTHTYALPEGSLIPAGGYLVIDDADFGFGLGGGDSARLFLADGTTLVDSYEWTAHAATTYGRCADGIGAFIDTFASTKGEANACEPVTPPVDPTEPTEPPAPATPQVVINEIVADAGDPDDWIELANPGATQVDVSGLIVKDDDDTHTYAIPASTTIAAGGYLVLEKADFGFGLGKNGDAVRLFAADGTTLIDSYTWTANTATSYGRCPDASGAFGETAAVTKGTANDCGTPAVNVVFNEIESNGDDTDWVEVMNLGAEAADLTGYVFKDDNDSHAYVLPAGSIVPAGGLMVIDQFTTTAGFGFDFGLGNPDEARLFAPDGTTLVANYAYTDHAGVTWARCPDGTGEFVNSTTSTKGEPNDCGVSVRINEVESSGGTPGDWVELVNFGASTVDLTGFVFKDNDDAHSYALPQGSTIAAGGYLVIDEANFGFGLGGGDSARLFAPDGTTLIDAYSWTEHAPTTYGRCPDASGDFAVTSAASKGTVNECAGIVTAQAWPGGTAVSTVDPEPMFSGDLSGIDYDPTTGDLWAVENGNGLLYRFQQNAQGAWVPVAGWESGKALRYTDGGGLVDSEGVTVTSAGTPGGVYVSSERNNAASSVSRPAVLRYDVSGTGSVLTATAEWNLAADFPGLGANKGLEGVTFISDAFLTQRGFVDESTGQAYSPADYAGHGNGLFVVGVEGTASMYAYALMPGGAFQRVATIGTDALGWALVADVQFDAERGVLFAVCDEACGGQIAAYTIDASGAFVPTALYERPAGMGNFANEGFAMGDASLCTADGVPTFYADDADTDGFSLRTGTLPCTTPATTANGPGTVTQGGSTPFDLGAAYANSIVDVWVHSTPTHLGPYTADGNGRIVVMFPSTLPAGSHTLVFLGQDGTLAATRSVEVTAATDPVYAGDGELAFTGADGMVTTGLVATVLILLGLGLTLRRRA